MRTASPHVRTRPALPHQHRANPPEHLAELQVVFDEYHFGKFVNGYITGEYFFDVHRPLGKLGVPVCVESRFVVYFAVMIVWLSQIEKLNQEAFDFCPKPCPSAAP